MGVTPPLPTYFVLPCASLDEQLCARVREEILESVKSGEWEVIVFLEQCLEQHRERIHALLSAEVISSWMHLC